MSTDTTSDMTAQISTHLREREPTVEMVRSEEQFQTVLERCNQVAVLGIDTEFVRFKTYYPVLGLVQISDGERCYLLDPLALTDLTPLKSIFLNKEIVKVFHSCSEDLEVFVHHLGYIPTPIFDTQIASAILGDGFSLSYQNLVKQQTGVHLQKEETRSDWLQRPLSDSQCQYAALDVSFLPPIYRLQRDKLVAAQRLTWLEEECLLLSQMTALDAPVSEYYLRVKSIWKLDRQQFVVLRALCEWREKEAQERDVPRNRVVDDKLLYAMAKSSPKNPKDLAALDMFPGQIRKHGQFLLDLSENSVNVDESLYPERIDRPLPPQSSALLKELKKIVERRADEVNCSAEILAKRKHLEELLRSKNEDGSYYLPEVFKGWRKQVIGDELLSRLN